MKKFEILSHTADLRIRSYGESKEELFLNSLLGMSHFIKKPDGKERLDIKKLIVIKSSGIENLLVDFLSEILSISDANQEIFYDINFNKLSDTEVEAEIKGMSVDKFDEDIKAVTYNEISVEKNREGLWEATVVYDI